MRLVIATAALLLSPSLSFAQNVSFAGLVNGSGSVFVANLAAGGALTQLTSGGNDAAPEWSFDGTKLTFQRNAPSMGYGVMVMNADGSGLKGISPAQGQDLLPSWTPGGQIVFSQVIQPPSAATMNLPVTALMIMNSDGTDRQPLVTPSAKSMFNLAAFVSPDGTKIAFECGPAFSSPLQICEINSNGTGFKYLTEVQGAASADPHWSPDGTKIIFDSTRAGGVNEFSMNADGSDVTQLTTFVEPLEGQDGGYSPDGTHIVFEWDNGGNQSSNPAAPAAVWIMNANGTDQQTLGIPCAENGCAPRFQRSP
jgi:TolB protein